MKNGHLWKRMLSLLLTAVMVFALLPGAAVHVHAEEHECWGEYTEDGAEDGENYDDVCHFIECTICGTTYAEEHCDENGDGYCDICTSKMHLEHTFDKSELDCDEEYHYVVCDGSGCGEIKEDSKVEHIYDDEQDMICDVCKYNRCSHEAPHVGVAVPDNKWYHKRVCSGCYDDDWYEWEDHYDEDDNGQCDGCDYWLNCPHARTAWDDSVAVTKTQHQMHCSDCGETYWADHDDGDDDGTLCDVCSYEICLHAEFRWNWDVEKHWKKCTQCGERLEDQGAHTYADGESKCSACGRSCTHEEKEWDGQPGEVGGHRMRCLLCSCELTDGHEVDAETGLCTVCGYEACTHTNMDWEWDDVDHRTVCTDCGEKGGWEAHEDSDEDGQCDVCRYLFDCPHTNMGWEWDDVDHRTVCADCEEPMGWESHAFDEDGACTVCGHECQHEIAAAGDGESNGDGTHSGVCDYCGLQVTLACHGYDGPYTDNDHRLLCEVCGYLDAVSVEHTFEDGYLYYDDEMHYPECDGCMYHLSEGEYHSFTEGSYGSSTKAAHLICCDAEYCGYSFWQGHDDSDSDGLCDICGTDVEEMLFDVYVGGVGLEDGAYLAVGAAEATTDRPDGGYAYYEDGVLTLHGYTYEGAGIRWSQDSYAALYAVESVTIVREGENTLVCDGTDGDSDGIAAQQGLTIEGEGSLYVESGEDGIGANGDIWVHGGRLTIRALEDDGFDSGESVCITGGTVNITAGDHGMDVAEALTITGGTVNIEAGDDGMDVENGVGITGATIVIHAEDNGIDGNEQAISIRDCTLEIVTENANGIETQGDVTIVGATIELKVGNYAVYANAATIEDSSVTANCQEQIPDGAKMIIAAIYQDGRMLDVTLDTDFDDGLAIPTFAPWGAAGAMFYLDANYVPLPDNNG